MLTRSNDFGGKIRPVAQDSLRAPRLGTQPLGGASARTSRLGQDAFLPERTYRVQAGDTLTDIAEKLLGDRKRWQEIYNANRDQLSNPNVLTIGSLLRLSGPGTPETSSRPTALAPQRPAPQSPAPVRMTAAHGAQPVAPSQTGGHGWLWDLAREMGLRHDVDPRLLMAIVEHESKGDPGITSPAGAQGLMQLMPGTARSLGVSHPLNPRQNMDGGARYIKFLLNYYNNNLTLAVAAFNAGAGNVDRYGGIPPFGETRAYVPAVLGTLRQFKQDDARVA
jgi:soluble lytic murein transglycosylase-like protein